MQTYVKKLISLNPKKYKCISLDIAEAMYWRYLIDCMHAGYWNEERYLKIKTFNQFLKTEIQ